MTDPRCSCWDDPNPPPGARCKRCGRTAPGERKHTCHARGCAVVVKPELLMCLVHWRKVPRTIQRAVWASYRRGQCDDMNPSEGWHQAADAAIGYVAALDGQALRMKEVTALRALGYETTTNATGALVVQQVGQA
jgi:hypothetical protein